LRSVSTSGDRRSYRLNHLVTDGSIPLFILRKLPIEILEFDALIGVTTCR